MPAKNLGPCSIVDYHICLSIEMLTEVLYHQQRWEHASLELDPTKFVSMIKATNPQLKGFFNYMTNAIIPKERSAHNINEARKSIVGLCYMIAEHNYLFHVYNIDNYHSIHENHRPDTVSTSTANHFATCVAKPITDYPFVPIIYNGMSVHNLENVEASRICWYLIHRYTGIFDYSYSDYQLCKTLQYHEFDPIELLTIHSYANNIKERKEERSTKGLQLVGLKNKVCILCKTMLRF
ncbi:hypothetical protein C2G38_2042149 [Gigaspora rosea]|uniref:Uncharacterized protein n=1 Tax=Gigaspora rosea TaxID=44941 RepID=A0A397URQ9_9GLOM|nr:hypothetical protein C2G38_2042149 [Gigaspora rosea]